MILNKEGKNGTYEALSYHAKRSFYYKDGDKWNKVPLVIDFFDNDTQIAVFIKGAILRDALGTLYSYPEPEKWVLRAIEDWGRNLRSSIAWHLHISECDVKEATNLYDLL